MLRREPSAHNPRRLHGRDEEGECCEEIRRKEVRTSQEERDAQEGSSAFEGGLSPGEAELVAALERDDTMPPGTYRAALALSKGEALCAVADRLHLPLSTVALGAWQLQKAGVRR